MSSKNIRAVASVWVMALVATGAQAFQIVSLSPQGEIARVRQVAAKFDESAVNFGDPRARASAWRCGCLMAKSALNCSRRRAWPRPPRPTP